MAALPGAQLDSGTQKMSGGKEWDMMVSRASLVSA